MATVSNQMPGGAAGNFLEDRDDDVTAIRLLAQNVHGGSHFMDLIQFNVEIEIHMSTAFVKLFGLFRPKEDSDECVLEVPMNQRATATFCSIKTSERAFESEVVSTEEIERYAKKKENTPYSKYNPDVFYFPFEKAKKGEDIHFEFTYFEFLVFVQGSYRIRVPMVFQDAFMPSQPLQKILNLRAIINSGTVAPSWNASHILLPLFESENRYELRNDNGQPWSNTHFDIGFNICHDKIMSTVIKQEASSKTDNKGHFCIFATPPVAPNIVTFGRRVVFILDKSGSMQGNPMLHALNAISQGISSLTPDDYFTVIAFSENQYFFSNTLVPANVQNTSAAISWTQSLQAGGLTDILVPLRNAIDLLESSGSNPQTMSTVPSVFLITDGAVENERDICTFVRNRKTQVRVNTFGIGVYCNHVFLKMLALIGRGYCEVAFKTKNLYEQMMYLINMTNVPVLTDVKVGIANSAYDIEILPHPIPDLFVGAPLVISGSYNGYFPATVFLMGTYPNGEKLRLEVNVTTSPHIPVQKISVKQKLDLMTSQAWLSNSNKIKEKIVELSCAESIPCAHTAMIAYEVKAGQTKKPAIKDKRFRRNLLIGVGVVVVLGVVAVAFGDIFGSMGTATDAIQGVANAGGGGGCGNCNSGDCACDCGDCGGGAGGCDCNCADGDCGCCGCEMDCGGGDCGGCDCNC